MSVHEELKQPLLLKASHIVVAEADAEDVARAEGGAADDAGAENVVGTEVAETEEDAGAGYEDMD